MILLIMFESTVKNILKRDNFKIIKIKRDRFREYNDEIQSDCKFHHQVNNGSCKFKVFSPRLAGHGRVYL